MAVDFGFSLVPVQRAGAHDSLDVSPVEARVDWSWSELPPSMGGPVPEGFEDLD